jgi:hypothetical protein
MATTQNTRDIDRDDERRANPMGAYIATLGALILLVSVWLDWLTQGPNDSEKNPSSGYEGDGVIPLLGYLAIGFAVALLYATVRADRRQHRGLSLASFAVGLAALLWSVSFLIDPISTVQYNENVSIEIGAWIGALGALIWTVGSFLLAKEPEGDREPDGQRVIRTAGHVESRPEAHGTTGVGTGTPYGTTTHGNHGVVDDGRDVGQGSTGTGSGPRI